MTPSDTAAKTRAVEASIELDATPEEVWRALTDADEIVKWFCFDAEVAPGAEGSVRLRWTDRFDWVYRTRIWEPGRHLRLVSEQKNADGTPALITLDYLLEGRGGRTVLRVVHSGFGPGAEWDDEVDGTGRGWYGELRNLRLYLKRHRGARRSVAWVLLPNREEPAAVWQRVMGPDGFVREGSVEGLREGEHYRITAATGEVFEGQVLVNMPPKDFAGTVEGLSDGLVRYGWEGPFVSLWLATWGGEEEVLDRFAGEWSVRLQRLFGTVPEALRVRG